MDGNCFVHTSLSIAEIFSKIVLMVDRFSSIRCKNLSTQWIYSVFFNNPHKTMRFLRFRAEFECRIDSIGKFDFVGSCQIAISTMLVLERNIDSCV